MISVDGDTSTNDCVFLLANGASRRRPSRATATSRVFRKALVEVAQILAKSIARDGEGADKLIEVTVSGRASIELARAAARGITVSPLIKCAIHGADPNWGRILARLGGRQCPRSASRRWRSKSRASSSSTKARPRQFDRSAVRVKLWDGHGQHRHRPRLAAMFEAVAWGCDLSKRYVDINAEYAT